MASNWLRWAAVAILPLAALGSARPARAFERQWHLGVGGGLVATHRAYRDGPAVALHGVYGISDVFDARLELRGSQHDRTTRGVDRDGLLQGALGLAYKLDVIEWIPYLGVRAGYYRFLETPPRCGEELELCYARGGGVLGAMFGVDYAFSRHAAIGAEVAYDLLLPRGRTASATLHLEYRWGW